MSKKGHKTKVSLIVKLTIRPTSVVLMLSVAGLIATNAYILVR